MHPLRFILPFARRYRGRYVLGLALVPVSVASSLGIPWLTGECVGAFQEMTTGGGEIRPLLLALLGLAVAGGLALFAVRWLIISASRRVEFDLRHHLFSHLQSLDQLYYTEARTGDIMNRVTSDVERVRLLVGPIVLYMSRTATMLAAGLPLMIAVSWQLTLLVMLPLSLMTIAVRIIGPRVHRAVFQAQETLSELSSLAQEDFSGVRVVKSFVKEEAEKARFADVAERYFGENLRAARIAAWMQPLIGGVGDLALIVLLLVGGYLILAKQLVFADFVKFAGYQVALIWPMLSIGWVVNQYYRAKASVERLEQILAVRSRVEPPPRPVSPPGGAVKGHVSIRGLTFRYASETVLDDVHLEVPAGQTIAITGRTGSGKSTLVHMIPRILPPPDGTVFVDGVDVNQLPLDGLRGAVGFVPQESFLFSRSIRENIAFGVGDVEPKTVFSAAETARLDKDVDQFPRGYEEMVGERGVTLSGGQKQRVALARALLIGPRILVLDDAFSAVDTHTEEEIVRNLDRATSGLTTILVSHRVSSIAHADRIYVLDEGRIAEEGRHEELIERGGLYAEIYRLQQLTDELDSL